MNSTKIGDILENIHLKSKLITYDRIITSSKISQDEHISLVNIVEVNKNINISYNRINIKRDH
jgi:hypothetical protein